MSKYDIWSGGHYYDLDEALAHAQDCFEEDLREIWQEATGAQRIQISKERGVLGITDKLRRALTATEQQIADELSRALYEASLRQEPAPGEVPF